MGKCEKMIGGMTREGIWLATYERNEMDAKGGLR